MRRALLFLLLFLPVTLPAQEKKFSVDADYLTRGEIRNGGIFDTENGDVRTAAFILGRTRLGAFYSNSLLSTRLTVQHAGTWGSSEGSSLSMNEAWAKLQSESGFFAQVGRQMLSYDDQRIFGSDDWSMTGISHDGLKAGFEGAGHKVHLFGAYNQDIANIDKDGNHFSGGVQPYKSLAAAWYHYDIPAIPLSASLLWLDMGMQDMRVIDMDMQPSDSTFFQMLAGTFISWHPKKWGVEAAYYYQWGRNNMGTPIDAWMASVKATASPSDKWAFRAGYDYLSGEEDFATPTGSQIGLTQHKIVRGFSSVYGSNHKFYGAMDFFYVSAYVNGFTPGLQNLYTGVTWTPGKRFSMDGAIHYLATAAPVQDASRSLGHEAEISATWTIIPSVALSAGYSFMQGTETMSILKRSSNNNRLRWGWLMLQITPEFFSISW